MVDEHAYSQPMMEEHRGRCSQILNASRAIGDAASKPNKQRGVARWCYMRISAVERKLNGDDDNDSDKCESGKGDE